MIDAASLLTRIDEAVGVVRSAADFRPETAIILGTGLSGLAAQVEDPLVLPYEAIPGFPTSTVEAHAGRLVLGTLEGRRVAVMQGRTHGYEGYALDDVTFPVRVLRSLGAERMLVSNVSGGVNPLWSPGDLVLITDHINLLGDNPLVGPNIESIGPRFPDMSEAYDRTLCDLAREEALRQGIQLREGVYVAVPGPCLETAAEYRMLRAMGADMVGMSTVPEVLVARHSGMQVLGFSIITNVCLPDVLEPADIGTIVQVASEAEPSLTGLVRAVVSRT